MYLIILVIVSVFNGALSAGPTFQCFTNANNICVFDNVKLTESNAEWEPTSNTSAPSVTKIQFTNSQIPVFSHSICRTFQVLEELLVPKLGIKTILEDAFHACVNVKVINCDNNDIEGLNWNTFRFNKNLKRLSLAGNGLRNLDPMLFSGVPELEFLSVDRNNLTSFSSELLKGNNNLEVLRLDANEISDLDEDGLVKHLPNLKDIYFDLNEIACVRVVEIEQKLKVHGIVAHVNDGQISKFRYYPQEKVLGLTCSPDISWSAAQYRKSKSGTTIESDSITLIQKDIEELRSEFGVFKEHLKNLEKLLRELVTNKQ